MNALTLTAPGQLEYGRVPDPEVGPGDALVEIRACGICGSDVHGMDGSTGRRLPPIVMGHEASGVIRRARPGCDRLVPGRPCHLRLHGLVRRLRPLSARPGQPLRPPAGARRLRPGVSAGGRVRRPHRRPGTHPACAPRRGHVRPGLDGRAAVGRPPCHRPSREPDRDARRRGRGRHRPPRGPGPAGARHRADHRGRGR